MSLWDCKVTLYWRFSLVSCLITDLINARIAALTIPRRMNDEDKHDLEKLEKKKLKGNMFECQGQDEAWGYMVDNAK